MMAEFAFWVGVAIVLYAYLGYPCALMALAVVRSRPVRKGPLTPHVSFIITVHNEQARVREKIENTLAQDYPAGRLEVIVASDCSTDATDEIVGSYAARVRLVRAAERRGKEAAQQLAVEAASGEVLVFSDVATGLLPDAVSTIVRNFCDPSVGCVSSTDRFIDRSGKVSGEGAYVKYEMFLRALETRVNSLVGLSGSFFAARRDVCQKWSADRQSDFNTLLNAIEMGLRGVLDPESAGFYEDVVDSREFRRKTRTVVRGLSVLGANLKMMNPFRHGLFAWQLASHKLCRWLVPFGMLLALGSNLAVASHSTLYLLLFAGQLAFYTTAVVGMLSSSRILRLPAFLLLANVAVLAAWVHYLRGERMTTWTPSERLGALPQIASR